MLYNFAHTFKDRLVKYMESSAKDSVYNVYIDMVRDQMTVNK